MNKEPSTSLHEDSRPAALARNSASQSPFWSRAMRIVRRLHLYSGLLLMPWVLLFALTALSFNHPTMGRDIQGTMLPATEVQKHTGFSALNPSDLAREVTRQLHGDGYALKAESARFSGWPLFVRPSPGGTEVIIVGLEQGRAIVSHRPQIPESRSPRFRGQNVTLPTFDMQELAHQLSSLHGKPGTLAAVPLRPHPDIHPELRFVVEDAQKVEWNVVYNLTTGMVDGRPRKEARHAPVVELLESLHKQHHYPASLGATFFWALFQDLTALTLAFWALSGLAMWWQLKKLRLVGAIALSVAVVLAALVMGATASDLTFAPERSAKGG